MKLYKTVYLANPHDTEKWDIVKGMNADFISGDSPFKEDEWNEYTTERRHELDDGGVQNWDRISDYDTILIADTIQFRVLENINKCDALILYMNKPCNPTTILETTYASTIGKPCYIIMNNNNKVDLVEFELDSDSHDMIPKNDENGNYITTEFGAIYNSIWPILGLPNVYELRVNTIENTKETVRKLLLLESVIEAMLIQEITLQQIEQLYTLANIEPQLEVAGYRSDFAYPDKQLAIEIDGHDYHKTKEQRKHDAKKDRALNMKGWRVIRFTGSEIYQNTYECFNEIKAHLRKI